MIYLRATPLPCALESVQQAFWGLYPPSARTADFPPPTILIRTPADETLFPNDSSCRRFAQLSRAFAQRTADRWNDTAEMAYLQKKIGRWMPRASAAVKVDSKPRLSGIMDTINATLAHGPETRLPSDFYDPKALAIIDKISVEEWYSGYVESREYRMLGIGALMGDVVSRLVASAEHSPADGIAEIGGEDGELGRGRGGEKRIQMALSGCHDTTLAGVLSSLGAFDGEVWPHYTSHIAVELFKRRQMNVVPAPIPANFPGEEAAPVPVEPDRSSIKGNGNGKGWSLWTALFGKAKESLSPSLQTEGIGRKPLDALSPSEKTKLENYYVRLRYNDKVMTVPGCKAPGKHLEGDESFCTLEAFKAIVDKYTPKNWKAACVENLGAGAFPETDETAGY